MSQYPPQPPQQPQFSQPMHQGQQPLELPPRKDNTMGLTGFIVSLVGLFLCGIPSLIGLVLSAIGLKKEPRGLAIAGVIIGLIGLIELASFAVMTYRGVQLAKEGYAEITAQLAEHQLEQAAADVGKAWEELEHLPTQEEGDEMMIGKMDMMNNSLVYQTDGSSFSIRSAGADGVLETEDDIIVGPFSDPQTPIDLEIEFDEDWEDYDRDDLIPDTDPVPGESTSSDGAKSKDLMVD